MLYKIVNPSDPYTIEANSFDVAAVACSFLGNGQYAFEPLEEGGEKVPMFFGDSEAWFQETFGKSMSVVFDEVINKKNEELADCFDSCLIGNSSERELFLDAIKSLIDPKERHDYWFRYHDKRRSSFNDIGGRAKATAKKLRDKAAPAPDPVPQQIFVR